MALANANPEPSDGSMGFLEHLDELRTRLLRSLIAIGAGMAVAFGFHDQLGNFILAPTLLVIPPDALQTTRPGEGFAFYLDVALIGGILLASPFVMFQVWRFLAPGLYANEKRFALPFVLMGGLSAVAGAAFSHYLLFPALMSFFSGFDSPWRFAPTVHDTFALYKHMLLAMVAVFQLPTIVFFLARFRMVTAKFLWGQIRYAVLIIVVAAAMLTPTPDPWNQLILAAPMLALYVASIAVAWLAAPRRNETRPSSPHLRLVVAASVLDQARRARR